MAYFRSSLYFTLGPALWCTGVSSMPKAKSGAKDTKGKARRREGVSLKASWAEGDYHAQQGSDESDSHDPGNTQEIPFRLVTSMPCLFSKLQPI